MKAKTLAVSIAVLLFMSVAANSRECGKEFRPLVRGGKRRSVLSLRRRPGDHRPNQCLQGCGVYRRCCVPEMAQALRMAEILEVTGRAYLRLNKNPVVTP